MSFFFVLVDGLFSVYLYFLHHPKEKSFKKCFWIYKNAPLHLLRHLHPKKNILGYLVK
jgi:hypothetical protein